MEGAAGYPAEGAPTGRWQRSAEGAVLQLVPRMTPTTTLLSELSPRGGNRCVSCGGPIAGRVARADRPVIDVITTKCLLIRHFSCPVAIAAAQGGYLLTQAHRDARALQAALDAAIDHIESLAIEAGRRLPG